MVFDCFIFLNEAEILEIRLNELDPVVDKFIVLEGRQRFNGLEKPVFFEQFRDIWEPFASKIEHRVVTLPHSPGPNRFPENKIREVFQRNHLKRILVELGIQDEDIVMLSDADEIPARAAIPLEIADGLYAFEQRTYYYYLNNRYMVDGREADWFGTQLMKWRYLKDREPDAIRESMKSNTGFERIKAGWHFSYMGGVERIKYYLNSWAVEGRYGGERILSEVEDNIKRNRDLFGRPIINLTPCEIDDSYPEFVVDNYDKFKTMVRDWHE